MQTIKRVYFYTKLLLKNVTIYIFHLHFKRIAAKEVTFKIKDIVLLFKGAKSSIIGFGFLLNETNRKSFEITRC